MGTMFPAEVVSGMFNTVKGKSSIAKLCGQTPISFSGNEYFTFSMDNEVNLVGEGEAKPAGGINVAPVIVKPVVVEYGARVSNQFMTASEEKKLEILKGFTEGYAAKVARAIDIMAMHGMNPRTKTAAATLIGTNSFDTHADVSQITFDASDPEANLEAAIAALGDFDPNGFAFSREFGNAMAAIKVNNMSQYPEFKFGGVPNSFAGHTCDVNSTVGFDNAGRAYVGDFQNAFKWGYAKEVPFEVIPYGDPDGIGKDLKHYNQVYLRSETYIGWGILCGSAFARIKVATQSQNPG